MNHPYFNTLFLILFTLFSHFAIAEFHSAGAFKVQTHLVSEIPQVGKNKINIWVQDKSGAPVQGAKLNVVAVMPAMGSMPAMYAPAEIHETKAGYYQGSFEPSMGGEWPLTIDISSDSKTGSITYDLAIGRKGLRCSTCTNSNTPGTIRVDPSRRQLIGIKTDVVKQKTLEINIRAAGNVSYDESRLFDLSMKFNGWIGELHANTLGKEVKKGALLFTVYSPELLSAQEEYLEILHRTSKNERSQRLKSAQRRLRLWGITKAQIKTLKKRGTALEYMPIVSPVNGFILEKKFVAGSSFRIGQQLLRIVDLSQVWVEAQVYDYELPLIKQGMNATVVFPEWPDHKYSSIVDFIDPFMENDTHTARVRVKLKNTDGLLRPEMFANIFLKVNLGKRLLVPESAVLYSGQNRLVFIDLGEGLLSPRKIITGQRNREWIEVLEGLEEGDSVVTSGNFLVAAESKLKAGLEAW